MGCRLDLKPPVLHFYPLTIVERYRSQRLAAACSKDLDVGGHGLRIELQVQNVVSSRDLEPDCRRRRQWNWVTSSEFSDCLEVDVSHDAVTTPTTCS